MKDDFEINGLEEFKRAIARNPQKILELVGRFLTRGLAEYKKAIIRTPWRLGMSGGGAPVDTGNLRDTHLTETSPWEARIFPSAPYAERVHEGTSRMKARPWLNYAFESADGRIMELQGQLLKDIVADLAK